MIRTTHALAAVPYGHKCTFIYKDQNCEGSAEADKCLFTFQGGSEENQRQSTQHDYDI